MMTPNQHREPLRIRMAETQGHDHLDGGWWPQSRELATELADLVDHFPSRYGRVVRALVSPPDWERTLRSVPVRGRRLKVGSFPADDTHLVKLRTSGGELLYVLVVPPDLTAAQGEEAQRASSADGNARSATEVLLAAAGPHA